MTAACPNCGSDNTRRGGAKIWGVYLLLIAMGVPAVVIVHLNAGIVAGIMLAAIVLTHLLFNERVCRDCGHQWRV